MWIRHPNNPIVKPPFATLRDCSLAMVVADPCVLKVGDRWHLWFGTGGPSPSTQQVIWVKHAESPDGFDWTVDPGEALIPGTAGEWDYTNAETPCVLPGRAPGEFLMWYTGADCTGQMLGNFPAHAIGLAISRDGGKTFTKLDADQSPYREAGLVLQGDDGLLPRTYEFVSLSDPSVISNGNGYIMYYWTIASYRNPAGELAALGGVSVADSDDGVHWQAYGDPILNGVGQPTVVRVPGGLEMWVNVMEPLDPADYPEDARPFCTRDYTHLESRNGIDWIPGIYSFNHDRSYPNESVGLIVGAGVYQDDMQCRLYYPSFGRVGVPDGWPTPYLWALNVASRLL